MSKALITEARLTAIANAIRAKNLSSDLYTPAQMAAAIAALPEGGITPTGTLSITQNGTHDVTQYASANVNVPNSFVAADEGKVVYNGALVTQQLESISDDGVYDTTRVRQVTVNVNGSRIIEPVYGGGSFSYISTDGKYYQGNGQNNDYATWYYEVIPYGDDLAIFMGDVVSNQFRAHFYAEKGYADFKPYVENRGSQTQAIYTATANISGTTELTGNNLLKRLLYNLPTWGTIVVQTSSVANYAEPWCVRLHY